MEKNNYSIILIGIDTLRADHLGCYGYNRPTSPAIDELAGAGMLFKNCFSQAPITAPSFMSIMTSRYPTYHGITSNIGGTGRDGRMYVLDRTIPTLAEILKQHGYRTGAFTDGGNICGKLGFEKGFDYYSENHNSRGEVEQIPTGEIFYWLEEYSKENFFLFLHTYVVHSPWRTPGPHRKLFLKNSKYCLEDPPTREELIKKGITLTHYQYFLSQINHENPQHLYHWQALYDGAINYVDDFIAKLLEKLSALKLSGRTIVVFTSDHGEEFLDHGVLSHRQLYNELLHVPLIIKAPHFEKPAAINHIVRSIDIFPTILELLRIKTKTPIHGTSVLTTLKKNLHLPAIADAEAYGYAIQNIKYKYIYPRYKNSKVRTDELYDIERDPAEKNNIALEKLDLVEEMAAQFNAELHERVSLPHPRRKIIYLGISS